MSGGALGAATFAALMQAARPAQLETTEHWFQSHTEDMLKQDFLSAAAWSTLFSDVWSRVLPCIDALCPGAALSRAVAFAQAVERAWDNAIDMNDAESENPFVASIYRQWSPEGRLPALLLNTTEVETGESIVISSAGSLDEKANSMLRWFSDRAPGLDISLSTAVGLSARFPGLAPAGWYKSALPGQTHQRTVKRRLVDGGYYDNSGVGTALSIIETLRPHAGRVRFILIALNSTTQESSSQPSASGLGEIISPLKALETARSARGRLAIEQAFISLDGRLCPSPQKVSLAPCAYRGAMRIATLATPEPVPLGWQLSARSREAIRTGIGRAGDCRLLTPETNDQSDTVTETDDWTAKIERAPHKRAVLAARNEGQQNDRERATQARSACS